MKFNLELKSLLVVFAEVSIAITIAHHFEQTLWVHEMSCIIWGMDTIPQILRLDVLIRLTILALVNINNAKEKTHNTLETT